MGVGLAFGTALVFPVPSKIDQPGGRQRRARFFEIAENPLKAFVLMQSKRETL